MKLLIIRHGDPNYEIDSLTPVGWQEAELLADRLENLDVKAFYVSPLGRAKDTLAATLKRRGAEATVLNWLQEFPAKVLKPGAEKPGIAWDWLPQDWMENPAFFDKDAWCHQDVFEKAEVPALIQQVYDGLDALLANHGYIREGSRYRTECANEDTVVLVCHFGLECVLLSHLLNVSPMILWHNACAAPTSVTTLTTEERREGVAIFRMNSFGDVSHLYAGNREPSFSARFCETYYNTRQRHD